MKIDQHTRLYGIIGYPVRHSLSPIMHNAAFEAAGINAVYLAFEISDLKGVIEAMRSLPILGMSVTIPYKVNIMSYLDEFHPLARNIGAVNTIVNYEGHLIGYNTDASGAIRALEGRVHLRGLPTLLVGAGGAARSIGFALKEAGAKLTVTNRTAPRGENLAKALGCSFVPWTKQENIKADLIVQATSAGMPPYEWICPVPHKLLKPGTVVMDIVYHPLETRLVEVAKSRGCITINGISMLIHQGAEQFRLWTKKDPPISVMEKAVTEALKKRTHEQR